MLFQHQQGVAALARKTCAAIREKRRTRDVVCRKGVYLDEEGESEEDEALKEEVDANDARSWPLNVKGVVHKPHILYHQVAADSATPTTSGGVKVGSLFLKKQNFTPTLLQSAHTHS